MSSEHKHSGIPDNCQQLADILRAPVPQMMHEYRVVIGHIPGTSPIYEKVLFVHADSLASARRLSEIAMPANGHYSILSIEEF